MWARHSGSTPFIARVHGIRGNRCAAAKAFARANRPHRLCGGEVRPLSDGARPQKRVRRETIVLKGRQMEVGGDKRRFRVCRATGFNVPWPQNRTARLPFQSRADDRHCFQNCPGDTRRGSALAITRYCTCAIAASTGVYQRKERLAFARKNRRGKEVSASARGARSNRGVWPGCTAFHRPVRVYLLIGDANSHAQKCSQLGFSGPSASMRASTLGWEMVGDGSARAAFF